MDTAECGAGQWEGMRMVNETEQVPDRETIVDWLEEGGGAEATDGCWVEPDGTCQHGCVSWLIKLGLI